MVVARKPVIRKPISKLGKLAVAGLASAAIFGAGHKAMAKESSQKVRRPAVAEERMMQRTIDPKSFEELLDESNNKFVLSLVQKNNLVWEFSRMPEHSRRELLLDLVTDFYRTENPPSLMPTKAEAIKFAKVRFKRDPELLKAVLKGITKNPNYYE